MKNNDFGYVPLNIANGIREFAIANPSKIAVIDGERKITYKELDTRSSQVANFFISKNYKKGDRVAVISGNRLEYPEIVAGLSKAGLIAVLVNPRSVAREVEFFLNHSGCTGLVIENSLLGLVDKCINNTEVTSILTMDGTDFGLYYESTLSEQKKFVPSVLVDGLERV